MRMHSIRLQFVAVLVMSGAATASATEWPQWRGPDRDGHAPGSPWSSTLENIEMKWRIPLGKGYPGPLIADDRVFVVETVDDETVGVRALTRTTGAQLWSTRWSGEGSVPFFARSNGDWVRSTPAWDGEVLYVGDMSEVLVALDGASGDELWRVDFPARFDTPVPNFGYASSPLVIGDFLYAQAANSLVKLDKRTGTTIWRSLEIEPGMGSNGAFSSPIVATLAGREQLVVLNRHILYGVEPEAGSVLWDMPLPHFRGMHILTPQIWGDTIFTSPYRQRSYRVDIRAEDGALSASEAWTNKATGYMSSPVVLGDHAYMHLGNGRIDCIDLATGESRWRSEQRFGKYWSMVWRDDRILALDSDGALYLVAANPQRFELLDGLQVADEETWGHLAVSGEDIFVRELEAISAWRWPTESASSPAPFQETHTVLYSKKGSNPTSP